MALHLPPLSATDVESDSDYLATPVDTPYATVPHAHAQQFSYNPFGAYHSTLGGSSASCGAPATRGAPHAAFGREVLAPTPSGQGPYYSTSDLSQSPPAVADWAHHGLGDFGCETTPWITRPKTQGGGMVPHAHQYTPDPCFEAETEPPCNDAGEVAAAVIDRMPYDIARRGSILQAPPSHHLHECGFHPCDGHASSSPTTFTPPADFASDKLSETLVSAVYRERQLESFTGVLPRERINMINHYSSHRVLAGMPANQQPDGGHALEGPTGSVSAHDSSLHFEGASSPRGYHDYDRLASSPIEYLPFSDQGLSDMSSSPDLQDAWPAQIYDHQPPPDYHGTPAAASQTPSHQAPRRRSFVINLHRPPSCPYVYPRFDELPPSFPPPPPPHARFRPFASGYPGEDEDDYPPLVPAHRVLAIPTAAPSAPPRPPALIEDSPKKPLTLACFFCRKRKIACGSPPAGRADRTCNQCARRNLRCVYPHASRRGMRPKGALDEDAGALGVPVLPTLP